MPAKKSSLTKADMERELIALDRMTQALNTAIVALYYAVKPDKELLKGVTAEEYVKFVQDNVHPIVRDADNIAKELAQKASESAKEAVEK